MSITTRAPFGAELEYMPQDAFGGMRLTPIAAAFGQIPELHGGGKKGGGGKGGVAKVVSVVAAVAVPFAAPAISSAIGLSATIGATAGSALTGAALGALTAKATGGDVTRGAIFGGIGGGISGYGAAASAPSTSTISGQAGAGGYGAGGYGTVATGGVTPAVSNVGLVAPTTVTDVSTIGQTYGTAGMSPAGIQAGMSPTFASTPTQTFANIAGPDVSTIGQTSGTAVQPTAGLTADQIGASYQTMAPVTSAAAAPSAVAPSAAAPAAAASAAQPRTFMEAIRQVPGAIQAKFSDPKALADLTLRAAGQIAGSAVAGSGLSAEEQGLLDAQVAELKALQQSNQALFNQRLEQAQGLIGESKYFDPEYFGLQRARRAQLAAGKAKRAGLRGLTGAAREAEARRFDLAAGRDVGTAYDVGYGQGISGRLQTQQAGLAAMPSAFPSSGTEFANIGRAYGVAQERRQQTEAGIGKLFGGFY